MGVCIICIKITNIDNSSFNLREMKWKFFFMYSNNSDIKIEKNKEIALNGNFFACSIQRHERGNKISSFTTIVEQRAILFNTN